MTERKCFVCGVLTLADSNFCSLDHVYEWERNCCKAVQGIPDPLAEITRLCEIGWAARRYILLETRYDSDVDAMYAAWGELKASLRLSNLTPEQATEELRKMDENEAAWAEAQAMAAIPGKDPSCPTS